MAQEGAYRTRRERYQVVCFLHDIEVGKEWVKVWNHRHVRLQFERSRAHLVSAQC